jgi:hypothetical protein
MPYAVLVTTVDVNDNDRDGAVETTSKRLSKRSPFFAAAEKRASEIKYLPASNININISQLLKTLFRYIY